jgi:hypothetical protein
MIMMRTRSNKAKTAGEVVQKRQRRLTAAVARKGPPVVEADKENAPVAANRVEKVLQVEKPAAEKPVAKKRAYKKPVPADTRPLAADKDEEEGEGEQQLQCPAYVSAKDSVKMKPGKRIKWRGAIACTDPVRRNLKGLFVKLKAKR